MELAGETANAIDQPGRSATKGRADGDELNGRSKHVRGKRAGNNKTG
jgi:hypothetical protein